MLIYERRPLFAFEKSAHFFAECNGDHSICNYSITVWLEAAAVVCELDWCVIAAISLAGVTNGVLILNRTDVICLQFYTFCSLVILHNVR